VLKFVLILFLFFFFLPSKYGEEQFFQSSALLRQGLSKHLGVEPLLDADRERVMHIVEFESTKFVSKFKDIDAIQNALQDYGIMVSVKKVGQDCSGITIDGHKVTPAKMKSGAGGSSSGGGACSIKARSLFYLRVSCWSFNREEDFKTFGLVLSNNLRLSTTTNAGLRQQFIYMYELYDKLFSTLKTKAFFIRAERLRHHLIFYYGHTAVFYVNKLIVSGHLNSCHRFDPRLESSMSVGVDEMSWDDLLEDNYDWSGLDERGLEQFLEKVKEYRQWVSVCFVLLL